MKAGVSWGVAMDLGLRGGYLTRISSHFLSPESGRKQKTPKKFTGEQPSISGTFGLKGLAKAEDKSRAHRSKKQESSGSEDIRKKVVSTSTLSKEALSAVAHAAPGGDTGGLTGLHPAGPWR